MAKHIVQTFAAGALLTIAGCAKSNPDGPTENPPPPEVQEPEPEPETENPPEPEPPDKLEEPIHRNPPPPIDEPIEPTKTLPRWDEVPSNHPEGATNPPIPVLVVKSEGECYKRWTSPFAARAGIKMQPHHDPECDKLDLGCGTQIECPPEAADILAGTMEKE